MLGKMSPLGPRSEMADLRGTFDPDSVDISTQVPTGCNGLSQVSTATEGLINQRPEFDEHYVANWTLHLDLWVMARIVSTVLGASDIKDLGQIPNWTGAALFEPHEAVA
jgi:lipopolysaccharide/colanic/teichoic acid biosynthesis glycosyltransferase